MTRGILIIGNESPLSLAVAAEAAKRVQVLGTAFFPNRFEGAKRDQSRAAPPAAGSALVPLEWNPSSPISARALLASAKNRLGRVDEAILICSPFPLRKDAEDMEPEETDTLLDDHVKGWFFLVREIAKHFRSQESGTLALILSESGQGGGKDEAVDLFGPCIAASFRALAQGLLSASFNKPYRTLGFSSSEVGENEAFASFVLKTMEEGGKRNDGKWHKYGKLGLFGR